MELAAPSEIHIAGNSMIDGQDVSRGGVGWATWGVVSALVTDE